MSKLNQKLLKELESAINDDVGNFGIENENDLESWTEAVLGFPSGTVEALLDRVANEPMELHDDYNDAIWDIIEKEVEKVEAELKDE